MLRKRHRLTIRSRIEALATGDCHAARIAQNGTISCPSVFSQHILSFWPGEFLMPTPVSTATPSSDVSAVSWAAILAGGAAAAAMTVVLLVLTAAVGLSTVSPWTGAAVSATTFKVTAGLTLVAIATISSTVGGYIAGRLRSLWTGAHSEEVLFRDTAHGFLAWCTATVAGVLLLGAATTLLVGGAAAGLGSSAGQAAQSASPNDYYVDMLLRPASGAQPQAGDPRREVNLIFMRGMTQPDGISGSDRAYLAQTVATRTGLSPADAEKRVNDVITEAKNYAEAARKFTRASLLWLTLSLFLGAFSASLAAIEGGQLRDGRWRGVIFRAGYR
jgi:hypothetical protein